jgi:hypothetical protein
VTRPLPGRQFHKPTEPKGASPNGNSLLKLLYRGIERLLKMGYTAAKREFYIVGAFDLF